MQDTKHLALMKELEAAQLSLPSFEEKFDPGGLLSL